ncbi:hypothetical protein KDW_36440 [Dictyobacter vulcani]|uniref:ESAT-6-like protein n=1 Tax=Dictyobacter vulcani TaxID=2607529 RepID=A0A5J4KQK8_9CHLR|nr:WXG100 family type VII secretion target [Dictyobacter vulcani]GER89482.1 hypothetical protein KDW_36440 [Dictyobacter vulcani]
MSGNQVATDFGEMDAAVKTFDTNVIHLEEAISNVNSAVQKLGAVWKGSGYDQFLLASQSWEKVSKEMKEMLHDINVNLSASNQEYQKVEQAVSKSFQGFQI